MVVNNLCMGCMNENTGCFSCPDCGWQEGVREKSLFHLPPGTILEGKYLLGRVLGQGGFGITYIGWDIRLGIKLAVKEYFPRGTVFRTPGKPQVSVSTAGESDELEYGINRFLEETRILACFEDNPNIVTVRDYFRANGTAYIVMSYLEGITLEDYLVQEGGRIPFEYALKIMMPVLDALRVVHQAGLIHRDISPENIIITARRRVVLIDFGAACIAVREGSRKRTIIMKPGYAPEEQNRSQGCLGPWSDVYTAAATLYRMITGEIPPNSLDRLNSLYSQNEDILIPPSRSGVAINRDREQVLLKALAVRRKERYQSIGDFQNSLLYGDEGIAEQTWFGSQQPYQADYGSGSGYGYYQDVVYSDELPANHEYAAHNAMPYNELQAAEGSNDKHKEADSWKPAAIAEALAVMQVPGQLSSENKFARWYKNLFLVVATATALCLIVLGVIVSSTDQDEEESEKNIACPYYYPSYINENLYFENEPLIIIPDNV